jgi:putative glutamine amidotransferase
VSASQPVVGITCYVEDVDRRPWVGQRSALLPYRYVDAVQRAGGLAVILPPREDADEQMAEAVLGRVDGLLIGGGADVEATRYRADPHPSAQAPRQDRDQWELVLADVATRMDLPLLGVCRGMQVMAVAAGAVLEQHLPDVVGHDAHSPTPGRYSTHPVTVVPGTRLAALVGQVPSDVPTYHHQAVRPESLAGCGYVPAAWHEDGTLEAMEDPTGRFRLGVQWHAEEGGGSPVVDAFVMAAGAG